jgi:hypothetical protein
VSGYRGCPATRGGGLTLDDFERTSILLSNFFINNRKNIIVFIKAQEYLFLDFKKYRNMLMIVVSLVLKYN